MMRPAARIGSIAVRAAAGTVAAGLAIFLAWPLPPERLEGDQSLRVLSREGTVLRQFRTAGQGAYAEWIDLGEQPQFLVRAALAAEDRRFYAHPGV